MNSIQIYMDLPHKNEGPSSGIDNNLFMKKFGNAEGGMFRCDQGGKLAKSSK
jgi:hypothetical protein